MTSAALDATPGEAASRTPVGPAGMDGIVRLAARVARASTATVVLGFGAERRVVAVTGGDHIPVYGAGASRPAVVTDLISPAGQTLGTLEVFGECVDDPDTRELLGELSRQAVALVELNRMTAELARTAGRDPLTGLSNRRTLEQAIASAITRAERGLGTPSVIVVDLDEFASVNDNFGRATGDTVLRAVAERLARTARSVDTVARIGGDEFGVLLEHTGGPGAVAALQRVRRCLDDGWNDSDAESGPVRASLGITTYRPGDSVASMIARADAEMYADKSRRA